MSVWQHETAVLVVDASGFTERLWAGLLAVATKRADRPHLPCLGNCGDQCACRYNRICIAKYVSP